MILIAGSTTCSTSWPIRIGWSEMEHRGPDREQAAALARLLRQAEHFLDV
jgi:hypothetical protein